MSRETVEHEPERKDRPGEKSRKPGAAAVGAFIAYGSAKHLWNNGAAKYIVGRRKTKVFSTRENPQDRVLLLAAGVPPVVRMHVRYTYTLKSKIDTSSVSIPGLVIAAAEPAETEREREKERKGEKGRKRERKEERERERKKERKTYVSLLRNTNLL